MVDLFLSYILEPLLNAAPKGKWTRAILVLLGIIALSGLVLVIAAVLRG